MIQYAAVILVLILAVNSDLKFSKIPNYIVLTAIPAGILINLTETGFKGLRGSTIGIIVPMIVLGIFFAARQLGAGDIKLFCSIGAFLGGNFVIFTIIYTFILAGILSLMSLFIHKNMKSTFKEFFGDLKLCLLSRNPAYLKSLYVRKTIKLSPSMAAAFIFQTLQKLWGSN